MGFSENFYNKQIDKALQNAPIISTDVHQRIVLFSDCHRGNGTWNDSFLNNKTIYEAALGYYFNAGFTYIELGDGDELWENRKFEDIAEIHADIFQLLMKFQLSGRFYMIWGNHDIVKRSRSFNVKELPVCHESIIIHNPASNASYHLIHGHQVDPLNNQGWKLARWMVRYLWKPLELAGIKDPTSAARNYQKGKVLEQRMRNWAQTNQTNIIAGHTHRPALSPTERQWGYYNTGSCVHPNTITCLEIDKGRISLIKWATCADENQYIHVCRHTISGPIGI